MDIKKIKIKNKNSRVKLNTITHKTRKQQQILFLFFVVAVVSRHVAGPRLVVLMARWHCGRWRQCVYQPAVMREAAPEYHQQLQTTQC
jgi:hypothetical protein